MCRNEMTFIILCNSQKENGGLRHDRYILRYIINVLFEFGTINKNRSNYFIRSRIEWGGRVNISRNKLTITKLKCKKFPIFSHIRIVYSMFLYFYDYDPKIYTDRWAKYCCVFLMVGKVSCFVMSSNYGTVPVEWCKFHIDRSFIVGIWVPFYRFGVNLFSNQKSFQPTIGNNQLNCLRNKFGKDLAKHLYIFTKIGSEN